MTRTEYLQELRLRLSHRMGEPELSNTMRYYEEYFDEAGPQLEERIIEELGSPERLVRQIMGEQTAEPAQPVPDGTRRTGLGAVWTVVLAICAAPIALPLMVGLVAVAAALVLAVLLAAAGIGAAGILCVGMGVGSAVLGFTSILSHGLATAMYFVGSGMLAAGMGLLLVAGGVTVAGLCFRGIAWLLRRALRRGEVSV